MPIDPATIFYVGVCVFVAVAVIDIVRKGMMR